MTARVPQFAFPFHIDPATGEPDVVEQGSLDEVAQGVEVCMLTEIGSRIEVLDYGVSPLVFVNELPVSAIVGEIERWEPDAAVVIESRPSRFEELVRHVRVTVTGREVR